MNSELQLSEPIDEVPRSLASEPKTRADDRFQPLGQLLVDADLVSEADVQAALQLQSEQGKRIGESMLELGIISEEELLPFMARQLGVPAVRLREGLIDPAVVKLIPFRLATEQNVLALFRVRGQLTVAMANPEDLQLIDELERITGTVVQPVFAFQSTLTRLIKRGYEEDFVVDAVTADLDDASLELNEDLESLDIMSVEELADGSPIINLVNFLIVQSVRQGVSDIHIEPGRKHTSVRYRIDGQLIEAMQPKRQMHAAIVSRIKVMGKLDIAEQRIPQDGRCQVAVDGKEVDLRISTLPTVLAKKS